MKSARILIVEDEAIAAELLQDLLQHMGHNICAVTAYGEQAVDMVAELKPDLVLMDIRLRGVMTGVEAAEKIYERHDIPVIYLTAYSDEETLERAKNSKPFGYLQKPFRGRELYSGIEIALFRHQMERETRERENSYRALADNLPGILYRLSLNDGSVQFFNDMAHTITGYNACEISPCSCCAIEALVLPEDLPALVATISDAVTAGTPFAVEYRIMHESGEIRHVVDHGRPSGSGIDGMIFDITERKRMTEELSVVCKTLEERKTFFESIISNNETGILVTDLGMRILLANPYVQRLWNKRQEEVVGRFLWDICPEIHERIAAGIDSQEILVNCDGHEIIIGFSRFNLKGVDRAVVGHIINFKDLSEIVRIRGEMRQKERLSTMGEVVARVAHEMRNPLFGMTAVGQILDMELQLKPSHKLLIDSFLKEASRLNNLVEELLDCTRELRLRKKLTDLVKLIELSLAVNDALAREQGITLVKKDPGIPLKLMADGEKLEQVLLNLLKNAIEASEAGTTVTVTVAVEGESVTVEVVDEGQGISENLLDKIFDVFYTTKKNGTGMGLSISKNIIEAHGGSLLARNNNDRGATFSVILPLVRRLPA